jgi:hypothetical protein
MLPLGKVALGARNKYLNSETAELMDTMLDTKMDLQGNPIPEDQYAMLSKTRQDMINQMGESTGLNLGPFDRIADAVKSVMNFTSSAGSTLGDPRSAVSEASQRMMDSYSSEGTSYQGGSQTLGSSLPDSGSDSQYSGSSLNGTATSSGGTSQSAEDNAESGSGGLYNKGGFISRRKR